MSVSTETPRPVKQPDRFICSRCGTRVGPFERVNGVVRCLSQLFCDRNQRAAAEATR